MINIAILGFGKIGSGTYEFLATNKSIIEKKTGEHINVKYILDIRDFSGTEYAPLMAPDIDTIVNDPEVSVVAEMMGGSHPAYEYTVKALSAGKHVVTSNKEVVANFGDEFLRIAEEKGVKYLFEASVGGGIPIIRPICNDLSGNDVTEINGILNGTTNYILTQMFDCGKSFENALAEAQANGYAELDPTDDIMGKDACRKICILGALAFGKSVLPDDVHTEGITKITAEDVKYAEKLGCSIKLLGHAEKTGDDTFLLMVAPFMVSNSSPLAHVSDVFNGIMVHAEPLGDVFFYGRGAGKEPTASAVVADIIDIAVNKNESSSAVRWEKSCKCKVTPVSDFSVKTYLNFGGSVCKCTLEDLFGEYTAVETNSEKTVIVTPKMKESDLNNKLAKAADAGLELISKIRVL